MLLSQSALCVALIAAALDAGRAHGELTRTLDRQKQSDELVGKIDAQLDALARGTQELAQAGDGNAAAVVDQLAQSGVHITAASPKR